MQTSVRNYRRRRNDTRNLLSKSANPDTVFDPAESPDDAPLIPDGYFDLHLSFNLSYNRPRVLPLEAIPIVTDLTTRFGLSALDLQAPAGHGPVMFTGLLIRDIHTHQERCQHHVHGG